MYSDDHGHEHVRVTFKEFVPPSEGLRLITSGPNDAVWFTLGLNLIGQMNMEGVAVDYGTASLNTQPLGITAGPDGALWFTESLSGSIGRITTHGVITEYPIPDHNMSPRRIAVGPDRNLWFTCISSPISLGKPGRIGKITTDGAITLHELPTSNSFPGGIAAGPEGTHSLWFAESVLDEKLEKRPFYAAF
jgi:virginiamycin B lyase